MELIVIIISKVLIVFGERNILHSTELCCALHRCNFVKRLDNVLLAVWFIRSCVEWTRSFWVKQSWVENPVFVFWSSRAVSILAKRDCVRRFESSPYSLHGFNHGETRFVIAKETGLLGTVNYKFMVSLDFTAKECLAGANPLTRVSPAMSGWAFSNSSKLSTCTQDIE